jgi:hypothetical protein
VPVVVIDKLLNELSVNVVELFAPFPCNSNVTFDQYKSFVKGQLPALLYSLCSFASHIPEACKVEGYTGRPMILLMKKSLKLSP